MKSVGILTLGCKVNTYESEYIRNTLEKNGYIIKDFKDVENQDELEVILSKGKLKVEVKLN